MKVREESLILQNVITVEEIIQHEEWFKPVLGLQRNLVNEDIYYTSPVVFKIEEIDNERDRNDGGNTVGGPIVVGDTSPAL